MGAPHVLANPPKVALIGGGFIGPVHAEALRRIGIQVAGLLDISPERARPLAERSGIAKVYSTLDELLARPLDHRRAHRLANHVHFEHAKRALEAGKHVLCEKPLAISSKETAELVKLAAARPKQAAGVNYNIRFYPLCQEMRAIVARGDLGRILSVSGPTPRTGCSWSTTTTGGSSPTGTRTCGPSPTSAPTGWTWPSSSPACTSRRSTPTSPPSTPSARGRSAAPRPSRAPAARRRPRRSRS